MFRLYSLLDPLWSRLPLPVRTVVEEVRIGPLHALKMHRRLAGVPLMSVYAYAVGDTLIDSGFASAGPALAQWAQGKGANRAILTHHHEDHAGGTVSLTRAGVDVRATPLTSQLFAANLPIPFYEHLAWGKPPVATPAPLPETIHLDSAIAQVIPAPGHCPDQICLWVPERGWLFSGDVFLHERVRLFRRDEDFAATVGTLERLTALPVESLFCAHRPTPDRGGAALGAKLQHLRDIEGRVRDLHARGLSIAAIVRELKFPRDNAFIWLSAGDASTRNLVASILEGPEPRREVRAITG